MLEKDRFAKGADAMVGANGVARYDRAGAGRRSSLLSICEAMLMVPFRLVGQPAKVKCTCVPFGKAGGEQPRIGHTRALGIKFLRLLPFSS